MKIVKSMFGITAADEKVTAYRMENASGASVTVLDYGATVQSICVPDKNGHMTDVVLGYDSVAEYETDDGYLGATIGRMCNRVGKGVFSLNGVTYHLAINSGENHSHGGLCGFDKKMWTVRELEDALEFTLFSPDGEEGYPGNLKVRATFRFSDENRLVIAYDAVSDQDTIINFTNHGYYNLNGGGSAMEHELQIFAERFLETDTGGLPTGKYLDVENTPFDFRKPTIVAENISGSHPQLSIGKGYDHTYVLCGRKAAVLYSKKSGISLTVRTDLPGMQLYTSNGLSERAGKNGSVMGPRNAVCLETQLFPDGMAHYSFPSPVIFANKPVHFESEYAFKVHQNHDGE